MLDTKTKNKRNNGSFGIKIQITNIIPKQKYHFYSVKNNVI